MDFLKMLADWCETCREHIGEAEKEMMACAEKYREAVDSAHTVPDMLEISSITIISEAGVNLSMFPGAGHFCSWAGICLGNNESAGKGNEKDCCGCGS